MPYKTQYGSHYHMQEGCHGATIPCGTEGLTPCADCCGGERPRPTLHGAGVWMHAGESGYDPKTGSIRIVMLGRGPAELGSIAPVYDDAGNLVGVSVFNSDGEAFDLDEMNEREATRILRDETLRAATRAVTDAAGADGLSDLERAGVALREIDRVSKAERREEDLANAARATEAGVGSKDAPTVEAGDIQSRIASLEHELALLRAQQEAEAAFDDEPDPERPFAAAEAKLDAEVKDLLRRYNYPVSKELYAEQVVDQIGQLAWEVRADMNGDGTLPEDDDPTAIERIADRLEAEGYGDKLDDEVTKRLDWDDETTALLAIEEVSRRRARRTQYATWDDWDVAERISDIQDEAMEEMGLRSVPTDRREELAGRIADRIRAEGLDAKIDDDVRRDLESMNAHTAGMAIDSIRPPKAGGDGGRGQAPEKAPKAVPMAAVTESEPSGPITMKEAWRRAEERRAERAANAPKDQATVSAADIPLTLREARTRAEQRRQEQARKQAQGPNAKAPAAKASKAKAPARKASGKTRPRRKADPMKGMTPKQEQDAFDREFSTTSVEGYMGGGGYEGSKSRQHLYGKELSGAVRGDLKEWLGHLGVPRGAVRVASHTYSGGQSLKVEARIGRDQFGSSEEEFKAAYRKHFWRMTPDWGTVETSRGRVDVSQLMGPDDAGPLMEDIIDTAWQKYQAGETEVDCASGHDWEREIYLNEEGRRVAQRMRQVVSAYNYDESNGMVDYFDAGFYAYPKIKLS